MTDRRFRKNLEKLVTFLRKCVSYTSFRLARNKNSNVKAGDHFVSSRFRLHSYADETKAEIEKDPWFQKIWL